MKLCAVLVCLCVLSQTSFSQGGSCATAIPITIDGVLRNYTISSSTGNNVICANTGSSPITYFSFTSNSSGQCVLLNIIGPDAQPVEIAMYAGGSCSGGSLQSGSSMCFDDGQGLWAPSESYTISPNTTYLLRIKTSTTGILQIAGQHITPANDDCLGAMPVGILPTGDNNACAKGGPGVPSQLCAYTLENTAYYTYTVASTGTTSIYIENINCDNGNANNSNGFQIGFFTGTCASLIPLTCSSNSGSTVIASTGLLSGGTKVYVGVDGVNGANCGYTLRATNAVALPIRLKNFSGWKSSSTNVLKWTTLQEFNNHYFEIQRSADGVEFNSIGRVEGSMNSETERNYSFVDRNPLQKSYYRLKQTDIDGQATYSTIVFLSREELPELKFDFINPVKDVNSLRVTSTFSGKVNFIITNAAGQVFYNKNVVCNKGTNFLHLNPAQLPDGRYFINSSYNGYSKAASFVVLK